jgi:hypothetical protein
MSATVAHTPIESYNTHMNSKERTVQRISLDDLERMAREIESYEGWMTDCELRQYREEYNLWLEEQWAIEEMRQGHAW